jgi:hypothetical protein
MDHDFRTVFGRQFRKEFGVSDSLPAPMKKVLELLERKQNGENDNLPRDYVRKLRSCR